MIIKRTYDYVRFTLHTLIILITLIICIIILLYIYILLYKCKNTVVL